MSRRAVVAVPARDEAMHLPACLNALLAQRASCDLAIVVLVNNSRDNTGAIARRFAASAPGQIIVEERQLPPEIANAGNARRIAMEHAAGLAGPHGIIMTTDADGRVAPDWLFANLSALAKGVDAVAGCAIIDPQDEERLPSRLLEDDARERTYADLLNEIAAHIDPEPWDPWPRHNTHSGASIAVEVNAFTRAGGVPAVSLAEDRAFFVALRRVDARIRHDPNVKVVVSGRTEGRAVGGMADTIRRRLVGQDEWLDDQLEPVPDAVRRARLRRCLRELWCRLPERNTATAILAEALQVPVNEIEKQLRRSYFGACWSALEAASPTLRWRCVAVAHVEHEIAAARSMLAACRRQAEHAFSRSAAD